MMRPTASGRTALVAGWPNEPPFLCGLSHSSVLDVSSWVSSPPTWLVTSAACFDPVSGTSGPVVLCCSGLLDGHGGIVVGESTGSPKDNKKRVILNNPHSY